MTQLPDAGPATDFDMIYRYEVPVDDQVHEFKLTGAILQVACRRRGVVEFWALQNGGSANPVTRRLLVFGTGHPIPFGHAYVGTALDGPLVWHLMERV